jgi:hypothetical protein
VRCISEGRGFQRSTPIVLPAKNKPTTIVKKPNARKSPSRETSRSADRRAGRHGSLSLKRKATPQSRGDTSSPMRPVFLASLLGAFTQFNPSPVDRLAFAEPQAMIDGRLLYDERFIDIATTSGSLLIAPQQPKSQWSGSYSRRDTCSGQAASDPGDYRTLDVRLGEGRH